MISVASVRVAQALVGHEPSRGASRFVEVGGGFAFATRVDPRLLERLDDLADSVAGERDRGVEPGDGVEGGLGSERDLVEAGQVGVADVAARDDGLAPVDRHELAVVAPLQPFEPVLDTRRPPPPDLDLTHGERAEGRVLHPE